MIEPSWPHDEEAHAWWVEPDRLLAGEYPMDRLGKRRKLELLVDGGVDTFVDLTTPEDGLHPYEPAMNGLALERRLDLRHLRFPIPDLGVIDLDGYSAIVEAIDAELAEGRVVYVHCWGGIGRTGTVIACWLMDHGFGRDEAVHRIDDLRMGTRKHPRPAPEAPVQYELLDAWAGRASA